MGKQAISILGCGWMGFPLAKQLVKLEYLVKGSTTSPENLPLLKKANVEAYCITADPGIHGEELKTFFESDILFLNIPFRRNLEDPEYYKQQIKSVIAYIEGSPIRFVIFASSTSVYPASMQLAIENIAFLPDNPRSKTLLETEQLLMNNPKFDTTVIRFAGLYGGDRKIGRVLAGRVGAGEANAPVNLIHLEDCVDIVVKVIQKDVRKEIFNACSDGHPTRKETYTKAAAHYGFEPPRFTDQPQTRQKIINNSKIKEKLDFVFRHPDPLRF